jgi:SWIM zinc finger
MSSLPHPVPSRMTQNLAALFGHADDTLVAWQRACVQVAAALRPQPDPERLAKALALAQDGHVVLEDDGSATVQGSGPRPYTLRDGLCNCPDAQKRGLPCKHALAVQIHQQTVALLMPSASTAPQPPQHPPKKERPARTRGSAVWDVHEAPASACFRFRVGNLELMYTLRGIDDAELQSRIAATLPTLQEIMEGCEERATRRTAERKAAQAAQAQQPQAQQPASAPADLQALLQQAVQQALAAQANGQAPGTPPPAPPSHGTAAANGGVPFCHVHQAPLELRSNERGSWWSHWVASEKRYCKGDA